jgi:hypothetical protein
MELHFTIHGVSVAVLTKENGFGNFVKNYLRGFESSPVTEPDCKIVASFLPGYKKTFDNDQYAPQTLGSGLGWDAGNNTLYISQKEISARITLTSPWHVEASFQKNFFRHTANKLFFSGSKTQTNYYRSVTRLLLQNIVFIHLAQRWGIVPISAAAIKIGSRAHIFVGLPGSGKSTLVQKIRQEAKAEIIAENFVLTDGERIFPFPEGNSSDISACAINTVHIITHGEKFSSYEMPKEQTYHSILSINSLTGELPEQGPFGSLLLIDPTRWQFMHDNDHETIKKLCERHNCRRLVVDPGADLALKQIMEL